MLDLNTLDKVVEYLKEQRSFVAVKHVQQLYTLVDGPPRLRDEDGWPWIDGDGYSATVHAVDDDGPWHVEVITGGPDVSYDLEGHPDSPPNEWWCSEVDMWLDRRCNGPVIYDGYVAKLTEYDTLAKAITVLVGYREEIERMVRERPGDEGA